MLICLITCCLAFRHITTVINRKPSTALHTLFNKLLSKPFLLSLSVFDLLRTELLLMKTVLLLSCHIHPRVMCKLMLIQGELFLAPTFLRLVYYTGMFENSEYNLSLNYLCYLKRFPITLGLMNVQRDA